MGGGRLLLAQPLQIRQRFLHLRHVYAREKLGRRFPGVPRARVQGDETLDDLWQPAGRDLRGRPREARTAGDRPPTYHHEVLRNCARSDAAHAPLKTDRRDVMLAAAIRTPADLDLRSVGSRHDVGPRAEMIFEQATETARLRHGEPARLSAAEDD